MYISVALNVPEGTVFIPQTRKEVSRVAFHLIDNLPNTYGVHVFIPKLKRWISSERKRIKSKNLRMKHAAVITHVHVERENIYDNEGGGDFRARFDEFNLPCEGCGCNSSKISSGHEYIRDSYHDVTSTEYMKHISCPSDIRPDTSTIIELFEPFKLNEEEIMSNFDRGSKNNDLMVR